MSILSKLMDTMRLNDDENEDYFLDDDYEDEDRPARKGFFKKSDDGFDDDYDSAEQARPRFLPRPAGNKVVSMRRSMEVSLVKPTSMDDAKEICDYLLAGKAVVLNMEGIHTEVAQRIIDFTSGLDVDIAQRIIDFTSGSCFAISGNLQKISNYIFIATPQTVELSGDFQDILAAGGALDVSGLNIHL